MSGQPLMNSGSYRAQMMKMSIEMDWEGRSWGEDDEELTFSEVFESRLSAVW